MLNKTTTSTGLIFFGISTILNVTSSLDENYKLPFDLISIEAKYNVQKLEKSKFDEYIESSYKLVENLSNKYQDIDFAFLNIVQEFAINQFELDEDFNSALDILFNSKINSIPTKNRF